jgi:hypothetical protein
MGLASNASHPAANAADRDRVLSPAVSASLRTSPTVPARTPARRRGFAAFSLLLQNPQIDRRMIQLGRGRWRTAPAGNFQSLAVHGRGNPTDLEGGMSSAQRSVRFGYQNYWDQLRSSLHSAQSHSCIENRSDAISGNKKTRQKFPALEIIEFSFNQRLWGCLRKRPTRFIAGFAARASRSRSFHSSGDARYNSLRTESRAEGLPEGPWTKGWCPPNVVRVTSPPRANPHQQHEEIGCRPSEQEQGSQEGY